MVRRLVLIAALLTCVTAYAIENIVWIDFTQPIELSGGTWRNVPTGGGGPTNWYDIYPDYEYTVLFARFDSANPLTNDAANAVQAELVDPGGGAAAAYTNGMVTYGGGDYTDCGDSFTNYNGATNQNWAISMWLNKANTANRCYLSSQLDSSNGEINHQATANGSGSSWGLDGMGEGSWGIITNAPANEWIHYIVTFNQVPGSGTDTGCYTNGVRIYNKALLGNHFMGVAGAPLYIGARPWPGSLLGSVASADDVIIFVYSAGDTNHMDDAKALALSEVPRSSN